MTGIENNSKPLTALKQELQIVTILTFSLQVTGTLQDKVVRLEAQSRNNNLIIDVYLKVTQIIVNKR